jgi:hypothetical protein
MLTAIQYIINDCLLSSCASAGLCTGSYEFCPSHCSLHIYVVRVTDRQTDRGLICAVDVLGRTPTVQTQVISTCVAIYSACYFIKVEYSPQILSWQRSISPYSNKRLDPFHTKWLEFCIHDRTFYDPSSIVCVFLLTHIGRIALDERGIRYMKPNRLIWF